MLRLSHRLGLLLSFAVMAGTSGLLAPTSTMADEYPSMALKLAPQFFYLWTDEECLTAERAVTNMHAIPWAGLQSDDLLFQQRTQKAIIDKCHAPGWVWDTERGPDLRHHVHLYMNEQVLVGLALSRYICRQTHGLHGDTADYWGEDYSLDENEDVNKFSPEMCDYYNATKQDLFEQVSHPAMRSDGGVTWPHVWQSLEWARIAVQNWNKP